MENEKQGFLDAGVDASIEKPLTPKKVASILREMQNSLMRVGLDGGDYERLEHNLCFRMHFVYFKYLAWHGHLF